jgi:2-polyprenyl-3-methyl-5-hydroxy-6-metoxy-1,4-benzoquinol methylase
MLMFTCKEELVQTKEKFDVVCAMEVIEHVSDPHAFIEIVSQLIKVMNALINYTLYSL